MRIFENCVVLMIFVLGTIIVAHGNSDFNNEMLKLHNEYRKTHHSGELVLDPKMSIEAMECAKNIMKGISKTCGPNWRYGTNLFTLVSSQQLTATRVISAWYDDGKNYDYLIEPEVGTNLDFFTQILWKNTTKLGVAFLHKNGGYVVVAAYDPPGNIRNKYTKNVFRP